MRAAESNAAWASKTSDNIMTGRQSLSRPASGAQVVDVQQEINNIKSQNNETNITLSVHDSRISNLEASGGGAGGGGLGSPTWFEGVPAPMEVILSASRVRRFSKGAGQEIIFDPINVPEFYAEGRIIRMKLLFSSEESEDAFHFKMRSSLSGSGVSIDDRTHEHTSTNEAVTLDGSKKYEVDFDLTGAGTINGQTVLPGDYIVPILYRDDGEGDTSDSDIDWHPYQIEIEFAYQEPEPEPEE